MSGANACDDRLCDASLHKEQMRWIAQCVPCSKCTNEFNASAVVARADAQRHAWKAIQAHEANETLK